MSESYKNIIYGQEIQTRFGTFRSFCSPLSDRDQLKPTMKHLQKHKHFKKYNKLIFAFRINTQNIGPNNEEQFEEGYSEDDVYDCIGERLLNLLRKYNVENVLSILAIEQLDPLYNFDQQIYHLVIDLMKDLLNTLYTKLVEQRNEQNDLNIQSLNLKNDQDFFITDNKNNIENSQSQQDQSRNQLKVFQLDCPDFEQIQAQNQIKRMKRVNHVFANKKPQVPIEKPADLETKVKIKQLINRINHYGLKIEKIIESLDQQDYQQLRFMLQYENNSQLEKILSILLIFYDQNDLNLLNNPDDDEIVQTDNLNIISKKNSQNSFHTSKKLTIKQCIRDLNVNQLNYQKTKKIKQILIVDKNLNYNSLFQVQPALANIFLVLNYLVQSFELGIELIEQQNLLFQIQQQAKNNDSQFKSAGQVQSNKQNGKNFIIKQKKYQKSNKMQQLGQGIMGSKMEIV